MDRFTPPSYLRNPHVQTILNSQGPKKVKAALIAAKLNSQRLELEARDGVSLLADFDRAGFSNGAVVVLIHGWEGSSQSGYQVTTAGHLLGLGFDVLRLNLRDHGGSHHLNRELFNSTLSAEAAEAIENFLERHSYKAVFLAGYSLGGNFSLRIAADQSDDLGIRAVAAVCAPVEPSNTMDALNSGWFVYEKYFFRRWSRSLKTKLHHFPDLNYGDDLKRARTLNDLNDFVIPNHTPYKEHHNYFAAYALSGRRLANLSMPAYMISSADDPIVPAGDIDKIAPNNNLHIDVQKYGGHCGFIENLRGDSWIEKRLGAIFLQHLETK